MRKRIRTYIAKSLVISGMAISIGSIGACENGDYSILECMACIAVGTVLGLAGAEIGKEE